MAEFTTSVEILAPPDAVFDHLVTEAGMTAWMGQHAVLDPRAGGGFAVDIAGYAVRGRYLVVDRPHRVVVSWGVAGSDDLPPGASRVEIALHPTSTGTRVVLTHAELPDADLEGHADGWAHFLPRLRIVSTGGDAGRDDWVPLPDAARRPGSREEQNMSVDDDTLAIVEEYHRAWTGGDVDRALKLVADDFVCHAPGERLDGKEAWRAYLAGFAPGLTGVTEVSRLTDGAGHVLQLYYPHTAATRSAAAAEYLTVRDGLLVENVLVFDRLSYGPPPGE